MLTNRESRRRCGMSKLLVGCFCLAPLLTAGCMQSNQYEPPPAPAITVALPVQQTVTNYLEETGTTEAVEMVQIRARVKGFLEEVNFQPGTIVEEGELLYLIEPRKYAAEVDASKAQLAARQVELNRAVIEFRRQKDLLADNATAERNVVLLVREESTAAQAHAPDSLRTCGPALSYLWLGFQIGRRAPTGPTRRSPPCCAASEPRHAAMSQR